MSRSRRLRRLSLRALTALAAVFAAAALSTGPAAAQARFMNNQREEIEDRNRDTSARTTLGSPAATACSAAAVQGLSDDESVAACDRALRTERLNRANRIATHLNRGALHLRRSEGALAVVDFDAVIEMQPDNGEAHLNRGAALIMNREPGPAVAAITQALSLGVRDPHKAYYNRAAAREQLGDLRGAYEDYSSALAIRPDWGPAEAELARFVRNRREQIARRIGEPGAEPAAQ